MAVLQTVWEGNSESDGIAIVEQWQIKESCDDVAQRYNLSIQWHKLMSTTIMMTMAQSISTTKSSIHVFYLCSQGPDRCLHDSGICGASSRTVLLGWLALAQSNRNDLTGLSLEFKYLPRLYEERDHHEQGPSIYPFRA